MSLTYRKLLHYLMSKVNKLILTKKDFLPAWLKRLHQPEILWINPPFHSGFRNNGQRNKFSWALDNTAAIYEGTWSLKLKCIWDTQVKELFLSDMNRFSAHGLMMYWMAVDCTIHFWDTALSPQRTTLHASAQGTDSATPPEKTQKKTAVPT